MVTRRTPSMASSTFRIGSAGPRASTRIALSSRSFSICSSTAIRPPAMMITRPQTASTSDMMWVDRRIVCRSAQLSDQVADLANLDRIETGSRLVEDQDVGIVDHRLGQTDALAKPSRQVAQDRGSSTSVNRHREITSLMASRRFERGTSLSLAR